MALFLLDTTMLTHVWYGQPRVMAKLNHHRNPASGDMVGVASVCVEEVLSGWLHRLQRASTPKAEAGNSRLLNEAVLFLARFPLFAITPSSCARYETLRKMKLNVGRNDLRLGALALELCATVVTDYAQDFCRLPGLAWVDWTK